MVEQPEHPWAPKDTDEMLQEIADAGYGVSGDRSSALAPRLIKAYNSKADIYEKVVQKKGQPLREGFSVVKVRAAPDLTWDRRCNLVGRWPHEIARDCLEPPRCSPVVRESEHMHSHPSTS